MIDEKFLKKAEKLLFTLDFLSDVEDFDQAMEEHDIDLQELIWGSRYIVSMLLREVKGN